MRQTASSQQYIIYLVYNFHYNWLFIMTSPNKINKRSPHMSNNKSQKIINHPYAIRNSQHKGLDAFQIIGLKEFRQKVKKDVLVPIQMQNSMLLSKSAPRCLQHSNLITLYCLNEHQPLCVTCMYQSNHHKSHKVVPLNRAYKEIEEQIKHFITSINISLESSDHLIYETHKKIQHNEAQFPQIIKKVNEYYKDLVEMIHQKKKEHLRFIQDVCHKLRFEYRSWSEELQRVRLYLVQKLQHINQKNSDQFLLFNRNIARSIANFEPILKANLCPTYEINFLQQFKHFKEVSSYVNNKLILHSPFQPNNKKYHHQKSQEETLQGKSIKKIDKTNRPAMTHTNSFLQKQKSNLDEVGKQNKRRSESRSRSNKSLINTKNEDRKKGANDLKSVIGNMKKSISKNVMKTKNRSHSANGNLTD